jgi:hypothetical protein
MAEAYEGIQQERVAALNDADVVEGRYVGYWMQQSQRAEFNPTTTRGCRSGPAGRWPTTPATSGRTSTAATSSSEPTPTTSTGMPPCGR